MSSQYAKLCRDNFFSFFSTHFFVGGDLALAIALVCLVGSRRYGKCQMARWLWKITLRPLSKVLRIIPQDEYIQVELSLSYETYLLLSQLQPTVRGFAMAGTTVVGK
jgi:hypothetical protein